MRELRAEVQTDIVTAVATSDRSELIHGHCAPNFFRLTLMFVNSACRHSGVGLASDVQLSSHRTHRPPQPFTVWHEETDSHVGKFVRASLSWRVWTSVHVRLGLRLCTCTSASARGGWCVGVFALHVRVPVCQSVARSCACTCACKCVRLCVLARAHACASRVCVSCQHVRACVFACVFAFVWVCCVDHMDFLCVLVYATRNTCGNNATDEKLNH